MCILQHVGKNIGCILLFIQKTKKTKLKQTVQSSSVWGMACAWTKERGWRARDAITRGGGGDWAQKQNHGVHAQFNLRLHGPGRFTCCIVRWWVRNVQDNAVCTRELLTKAQRFSNRLFTSFWTVSHIHNHIPSIWRPGLKDSLP